MTWVEEHFFAPWRGDGSWSNYSGPWSGAAVWLWAHFTHAGFVRGFLLAGAVLGPASRLPASLLPWVCLLNGGTVATLGALTTLLRSDAISRNQFNGADQFRSALLLALVLLVAAEWVTQMCVLRAECAERAARIGRSSRTAGDAMRE